MSSKIGVPGHFVQDVTLAQIFSGFLSLGDVCRFDSAICSKNRRPLFLKCIKSCIFLGDKNKDFGPSTILWLQRRSIRIRHLKCGLIDDDTAMTISSFGSCLHWLSLSDWVLSTLGDRVTNPYITDVGIVCLAESCAELRYVTDNSIIKLAELCPNLCSLNVSYCSKITDLSIVRLADGCPHLQSLAISNCCKITDISVVRLAEKCPDLHSLSHCHLMKDDSIIKLVEKYPNLQSLVISNCHHISDASILRLADGCPQLCSFKMTGCSKVTDISVVRLAEKCHHIHTLEISNFDIDQSLLTLFPNLGLIIS